MSMTVQIDLLTGTGPTVTPVTALKLNRSDDNTSTVTPIPTPTSTGTNFGFVRTMQVEILATGSLSMSGLMVGLLAAAPVNGSKIWVVTSHAAAAYVHATAAPAATTDNNITPPVINGATAVAMPLISAPPAAYAAGPFAAIGRVGNLVERVCGLDATFATAGTAVAGPTQRFAWVES